MGETVKVDDKGRITIPAGIRELVTNKVFKVELAGKNTIILRPIDDRRTLVKRVAAVTLPLLKRVGFSRSVRAFRI